MRPRLIDAHVHVWDTRRFRVSWTEGTALNRPMPPSQIDGADGEADGWIFVEADSDASPVDEARWVSALDWPGLLAIVADVDLKSPTLDGDLRSLGSVPLVRGVRHLLQGYPPGALGSAVLADGLGAVGDAGLVFDACVRWTQLGELSRLLERASGAVVLDHLGKPPLGSGLDSPDGRRWRSMLGELAAHPGLHVKLSGLRAEAVDLAELRRSGPAFLEAAVEAFGAQRCLFGSDWPVSTGPEAGLLTAEWVRSVRAVVGEDAWPAVAGANALRVYGVD